MNKNRLGTALQNFHHITICDLCLAFHDHLITLDRNNLTSILIYKILIPAFQYTGSQLATYKLLEVSLIDLDLLCQIKDLQDFLIGLKANSTKQCCNRQFLLTIDVSIHHVVDVCCKLDP